MSAAVVTSPHPSGLKVVTWHPDEHAAALRCAELVRMQRPVELRFVEDDE